MVQKLPACQKSLEIAQTNLIQGEKGISTGDKSIDDKLASARSLVDKFAVDIESEHLEFIDSIKKEREKLDKLRTELTDHLKSTTNKDEINEEYLAVDSIWRKAANDLLSAFTKIDVSSKFILPELLPPSKISENGSDTAYKEYSTVYQNGKQRFTELTEQRHGLLLDLKANNFRLVNDSGRVRASLIGLCKATDKCEDFGGITERSLTGIFEELRLLPLKFLAGGLNKFVEFKSKINGGFDNWADISRQLLIFLILIFLPFLAHNAFSWISSQLNQFRESILSRSIIDYRRRTQAGLWIARLNPFVPSVGMILSIHLARSLIEATDLQEVSYFLFYLELYFVYRATRLLLRVFIEFLFSTGSLALSSDLSDRAAQTARRLSRFFFSRYALLHFVEDTVRRALVYGIAYEFLFWISILVLINEVKNWQNEIIQSFETRFRQIWAKIKTYASGRLRFAILPILLLAIIGYDIFKIISLRLIKFDFFKRLISEVFRKKLEQDSDFSKTLKKPEDNYLAAFDYYLPAEEGFYIDREPLMAKKILSTIKAWLAGTSAEDLVVLVGNRGIGKTTSAKMIFDRIETEKKYFQWIEPRICEPEKLFDWLSELINAPIRSIEDFSKFEANLNEKIVLVIDDIHNLFIGRIGGFEAFKVFMEIISLKTTKVFWCLTANSHAWDYLQGVFGKEYFYGQVYEMRMWTDAEIQNLILARHGVTGYSRSFDKSISAYGTGNVLGEQVETQFFRLLWGQSRGNPRSALMYWISAASQTHDSEIHVGVPRFIDSGLVGTMSNDALMILAAIARHDSLTLDELTDVTSLNRLVVRKVIKESTEKELVWIDDYFRVRISSRAQNAIDYYLIGKNFLYE